MKELNNLVFDDNYNRLHENDLKINSYHFQAQSFGVCVLPKN